MAETSILPLELDRVGYVADGRTILDNISLTIARGERVVVLGPNGAGKSVLLRVMHGLLQPTRGTIAWSPPWREARRRQAMVFQRPVMLRRSAFANVAYALKVAGVAPTPRQRAASDALQRVGLAALAQQSARKLSGGEQQRVALARAWALEPELLLLDEPTANLDPAATRGVEEAIHAVHRAGATIVMTTHDIGQAKRLADRVVFLHQGRLCEVTPAIEFFSAPRTREAGAFLRGELVV